jgi:hypothetical protein
MNHFKLSKEDTPKSFHLIGRQVSSNAIPTPTYHSFRAPNQDLLPPSSARQLEELATRHIRDRNSDDTPFVSVYSPSSPFLENFIHMSGDLKDDDGAGTWTVYAISGEALVNRDVDMIDLAATLERSAYRDFERWRGEYLVGSRFRSRP